MAEPQAFWRSEVGQGVLGAVCHQWPAAGWSDSQAYERCFDEQWASEGARLSAQGLPPASQVGRALATPPRLPSPSFRRHASERRARRSGGTDAA